MNIWLIQTGEPLPLNDSVRKMRTAILCDNLVAGGHSVLWWASAFDHLKKEWVFQKDTVADIGVNNKIFAIKGSGYKKNVSLSRFIDHRIIAYKFRKLAPKMPRPDIIVASMPPHDLTYEAVIFANKNKIPIIVDIRDEWPDLFLDYVPGILRGLFKVFFFRDFHMVRTQMMKADVLIAMMDTLLQWGIKYSERPQKSNDRVFYLGSKKNTFAAEVGNKLNFPEQLKDKFVVTFIGTFVKNNNPSIIVDCAEKLLQKKIQFVLAGNGELFPSVKDKCKMLPNVSMPGWLNQNEIAVLLRHSHVGVCSTNQIRAAFPNKTFTYLSAGLPIISAFQGELKEIIEKHQIGFNYPPKNVDVFIDCVLKLYNTPDLYMRMAANSEKAFNEMFDADKIYREYAKHIEKIAAEYVASPIEC